MNLANATKGKGIAKLWARRKIASLEASRSYGANIDLVDRLIETTATEPSIWFLRLTSLVAVDVSNSRPDDQKLTPKEMPTNLPSGWEFEKVFGETNDPAAMQKTRAPSSCNKVQTCCPISSSSAKPDRWLHWRRNPLAL